MPTLNMSTKVYAPSRARLEHSQMEATAHWGPQQKIDPPLPLPLSLSPPFFNLILLFHLYLSFHLQYPWILRLYWASKETVVQEYSSTCTVCVYTGQISQYLAARLTFRMLYTSESCRCGHTAPVLSILTYVTSCLPTFTLPEPREGGRADGRAGVSCYR